MGYVDKKVALQYLANSEKMFTATKDRFLKNNKETVNNIASLVSNNDVDALYNTIKSIKGIALNIGSQILYDDSDELLNKLQQNILDNSLIERYIHTFRIVYSELENM